MGQAFITRRGNNYGFKKIEAPELYTDTSAQRRYYRLPKSMFPNLGYYAVIAQFRDTDNDIVESLLKVRVYQSGSSIYYHPYPVSISNSSTTYKVDTDYIYWGIAYADNTATYENMLTWTFEKGFIYEYK